MKFEEGNQKDKEFKEKILKEADDIKEEREFKTVVEDTKNKKLKEKILKEADDLGAENKAREDFSSEEKEQFGITEEKE